ncbi:MAG: hypothetical protein M1821_008009 [Bathelium mastoideum]|nr:MAG: hypothetical protein M1821_008009 [Bathelium mastoideum]
MTGVSLNEPVSDGMESEKLAYATFLAGTVADADDSDDENDRYFVATRILAWQLLHSSVTRTNRPIPFLVLVTEDVSDSKRKRLTMDGATVVPVSYLREATDWIHGEMPEWRDVLTKLRAWELTQYSRILFLDSDMILTGPLDGVFDVPAALPMATTYNESVALLEDESPPPEAYVLASMPEANPVHAPNPTAENGDFKDPDYFNAGFFLFSPSLTLFDHYKSVMNIPHRFDPRYPEQNLLNYAHRRNGTMPWQDLGTQWNIRFPTVDDLATGVQSLHDKWWHPHMDGRLNEFYQEVRWRMEGFYEAWDRTMESE